ncbi:MAG: LysR family transcriptional regulator [Archangium gephyra]|uniref:LysR family transcriptional regulator n=1 Tax=Archangium gephyra TaxID=48 RepID=A0A2W5T6P0_9BACT|nr:MAG: LysR family transcriptional regulator [Archangium gephyra]
METLSSVEAFVRSAEAGSFSAAARKLSITPAAVSKSVAKLEDSLGARLFQRSTRRLTLTEAGEHLFADAAKGLNTLQDALARVSGERLEPTGTLKVSLAPSFGRVYVQPVLPAYLRECPKVSVDWHFENRQVDLVGENFDVGIGAGIDLGAGIVAKELARIHIVAVASKAYVKTHGTLKHPSELKDHQGVCFRSARTGKLRLWPLRNAAGKEHVDDLQQRVVFNEIEAMSAAVQAGLGIALLPTSQVLAELESGRLVRVLPDWWADGGPLLIYFSSQRQLPVKTRKFIDAVTAHFKDQKLAQRFRADR